MGKKRFKEFCERILLWWRNSFFWFGYLLVLKHVSTCRRILLQKDSAFEMRSAKEQDIISNSKHCINAMTSYQFQVIVSILSHCINFESLYQSIFSNPNCINAMTWHVFVSLYQFRVIVGLSILRHSINLETFYQFRDIVSILRHCIYFEILYSYRDIEPRHHIHFNINFGT